ncbi:MAG TPA: VOC family protein [Stellaceae bacterium]|nr:VOC family protein [Stellaceae bacterium]
MNEMSPRRIKLAEIEEPVRPAKLAHVVFKTSNFDAMVQWYLNVLNGRIALASPDLAFITYDEEHHRIGIANVPRLERSDPNSCGIDHTAFTFADFGGLLKSYTRLKALGIQPTWAMNHGVTTSFYYKDPDGNKVELQFDNFETSEALQRYFETDPDFAANPLGSPFDPDALVAAYEAGAPLPELLRVPTFPANLTPLDILQEMGLGPQPV